MVKMANVMIFTRRNTTNRWRYIATKLVFAGNVTVVGLLDDGCDFNIMPSFYDYYRNQDISKFALSRIGGEVCQEIIQRCRLLRNVDRDLALKLIGAMWQSLDQAINQLTPDLALSFMVDFYPSDILYRLLKQHNIPFFSLSGGILEEQTIVTALGEYNFMHKPTPHHIERVLTEISTPSFAPSVVSSKKYDFTRFCKTKMTWNARSLMLKALRLYRKDPLNPEYMTTPNPGDDYYIRWKDWQVTNYLNPKWEEKLNSVSFDKRVFIGLQYYPEATTDYWVKDLRLANCVASVTEIARVLIANGFTVFLKDHPVMFGLRRAEIYESLSEFDNVVFVPYEIKAQELIERCKTTFTWTGTIGIQAALSGRCAVVSTTYYRTGEDFIPLDTWEDIALLPQRINDFQLPNNLDEVRKRVAFQVASAHIPGTMNWVGFNPVQSDLTGTQVLIDSLNYYLPQLVKSQGDKKVSLI
jgi:hypothetical protein